MEIKARALKTFFNDSSQENLGDWSVKRILVAVDGSDSGRKAIDTAATLAKAGSLAVSMIFVNDKHALTDDERQLAAAEYGDRLKYYASGMPQAFDTDALGQLERYEEHAGAIRQILGEDILQEAKAEVEQFGVEVTQTFFMEGDPAGKIIEAAENCDADLIVMGSRGRGGIPSLLLGSVSYKVTNLSPVSVLIVK